MDQRTIQYLHAVRNQKYIYVACITLWLYEYCCTFFLEVQVIWNTRLTPAKCLYLSTRYLQFFLVGALVHQIGLSSPISAKDCIRTQKFIIGRLHSYLPLRTIRAEYTVMVDVGMCLAEAILTIRTWAVLGRTRKGGVFLAAFFLALWVPGLLLTSYWFPGITPSPIPVPVQVLTSGCATIIKSTLRYVNYALIVPFYVVTVSLMAIKGFEYFVNRASYGHFIRLVYLDGILYYIYLLALSMTNLIVVYTGPPQYADMLTILQQFVASTLACRMMLNLRANDQIRFRTLHASSLRFDAGPPSSQGESEEPEVND